MSSQEPLVMLNGDSKKKETIKTRANFSILSQMKFRKKMLELHQFEND